MTATELMNSGIKTIDANNENTKNIVKLQTEISQDTKDFLRLESVRRHISMGMLIDELVRKFHLLSVSETTS
ncbi:hypothetical protein [Microcoleus sp. herbarium14]|uniref:hypothetical protein n=1 Tax=Microcoleus sp. herbarium14 TaxID=3055439 RepID=UPI002FD0029B